jgi:hypothetical protein
MYFGVFLPFTVSGFSKRLRVNYVPYAPLEDIRSYLLDVTNMTEIQADRTLKVTGASMFDVTQTVAVCLNMSSADLEKPLEGDLPLYYS